MVTNCNQRFGGQTKPAGPFFEHWKTASERDCMSAWSYTSDALPSSTGWWTLAILVGFFDAALRLHWLPELFARLGDG